MVEDDGNRHIALLSTSTVATIKEGIGCFQSPLIALRQSPLNLHLHSHVKAIKPYGAFVEIRGMSGLLHISQISFDRIEDLPSIMQLGMKLKCMIIDHDKVRLKHATRRKRRSC